MRCSDEKGFIPAEENWIRSQVKKEKEEKEEKKKYTKKAQKTKIKETKRKKINAVYFC